MARLLVATCLIRRCATPSLPALRAFLNGERLIAGGRWRAAADAFQLATAIDSTFWLAYWRYAFARGNRASFGGRARAGRATGRR